MRRSFPDSGVLIDAARGLPPFDRIAFDYFNNFGRIFLTSPFVRLETVPKAAYLHLGPELDFMTLSSVILRSNIAVIGTDWKR